MLFITLARADVAAVFSEALVVTAAEVAPVMLFQLTVLAPLFSTVLDVTSARADGGRSPLLRTLTAPVRNPVALASAAGVVVSATGVQVLAPVELVGDTLGRDAGLATTLASVPVLFTVVALLD